MSKTDAAFCVALALVVVGVACIYWPLAFITAGALTAVLVWCLDRAGDKR